MRPVGELASGLGGGFDPGRQGTGAEGGPCELAHLGAQLLDLLPGGGVPCRCQALGGMDQLDLCLPDGSQSPLAGLRELLLGCQDGSRQLGLLMREHQGGSQVDAGRRVRPGGLVVTMELEAEAGMAAAPVDADDALLVQQGQMPLHLALAAADPAGQGRVGRPQHRQAAPAGLRQELQQDLEGVARGFAQGSAAGRGVDGHTGLAHGRQGAGEALVASGAPLRASLAFLPLGADDAGAGGILAVVWPWVRRGGALGLHDPVHTLTGAFLG